MKFERPYFGNCVPSFDWESKKYMRWLSLYDAQMYLSPEEYQELRLILSTSSITKHNVKYLKRLEELETKLHNAMKGSMKKYKITKTQVWNEVEAFDEDDAEDRIRDWDGYDSHDIKVEEIK